MGIARRISAPLENSLPPRWVQVWVEAGREGRIFTYAAPSPLDLAAGDLVTLRLRGRHQIGLVVRAIFQDVHGGHCLTIFF